MADTPANTPRPQLSSAFDDMLAKSKKSFDDLYRLFLALDSSTVKTASGLQVSGRLLTLHDGRLRR